MKQPFTSLRSVCTHKESGCARCIDRQSPLDMRVLQNSENASNIEIKAIAFASLHSRISIVT